MGKHTSWNWNTVEVVVQELAESNEHGCEPAFVHFHLTAGDGGDQPGWRELVAVISNAR